MGPYPAQQALYAYQDAQYAFHHANVRTAAVGAGNVAGTRVKGRVAVTTTGMPMTAPAESTAVTVKVASPAAEAETGKLADRTVTPSPV